MADTQPESADAANDNRSLVERFTLSLVDAGGTSRGSENTVESYDEAVAEGERMLRFGQARSFTIGKRYELVDDSPAPEPAAADGEDGGEPDPFQASEENGEAVPADGGDGGDDLAVADDDSSSTLTDEE